MQKATADTYQKKLSEGTQLLFYTNLNDIQSLLVNSLRNLRWTVWKDSAHGEIDKSYVETDSFMRLLVGLL